ncbi:hypothetical protein U1Q18_033202 [Sarracenia purpurea var. burkii]
MFDNFAFHVLSDPQKRAVYDQYGEEGLKGQVPPPDAGGPGEATFSTGGGPTTLRSNPRNAGDIFAEFFGSSTPVGGIRDGMRGGGSRFGSLFDDLTMISLGHLVKEETLPCSLEELYKGTTKKMKISREIADMSGKIKGNARGCTGKKSMRNTESKSKCNKNNVRNKVRNTCYLFPSIASNAIFVQSLDGNKAQYKVWLKFWKTSLRATINVTGSVAVDAT